ncbi:MAG: TonB-dependent receptor [Thermoanaerobaculia bacterium]|nr:MAG: TonB-dependent receptor [Thermoanaerobaculia bacterium]
MRTPTRWRVAMAGFAISASLAAQDPGGPAADPSADEPKDQIEEIIVVTASRTEQALNEAPSAITVIDSRTIEAIPADDYGDLLRNVPGLNVSQTSARDINMTARGSTNTLSTSQLVLLDGRSLYLDFFGFVMWDFLPVNPNEIKQIEAVRGPGSAVWGANAMTGVVNLITKRPREMVGTSLLAGGGELGTLYGSLSHAGVSGKVGYKFSAGYYEQDPYDRPTGVVPGSNPPTSYPTFDNSGTQQPKFDLRVDYDAREDAILSLGVGYAGTDGIIHTGIGPFDIDKSSNLSYAKADWSQRAFHLHLFANYLDADSINLLTRGSNGLPLGFAFATDTYNLEAANTSVAGSHHIFTYGANYRWSNFDLEIAPRGEDKKEWGVFVQDEILLGDKVRWLIGGRYDDIEPLEDGVFTPRTSLLISPVPNHTFRLSYNEAFRTPSAINNYLDVTILNQVGPFLLPARADGNVALVEESMTAYEVGYTGSLDNGLTIALAAYRNETEDSIDFYVQRTYGPGNLPPVGIPPAPGVPPQLVPCFLFAPGTFPPCAAVGGGLAGVVPSNFSYRNIGKTTDQGVEFSLQKRSTGPWSWFFNASWQDEPEFEGVSALDQNIPPEWRGNLGLSFDNGGFFASTNVNYQDEAFWADVLNVRGSTDAFTQVNAAIGVRLLDERMTLSIIGANVFDEEVQQHIFGDFISRKVTGQLGFRF